MTAIEQLNQADQALTNLPDDSEEFTSCVEAARAAINAARAIAIATGHEEGDEA